jgi:hypothetical protein
VDDDTTVGTLAVVVPSTTFYRQRSKAVPSTLGDLARMRDALRRFGRWRC